MIEAERQFAADAQTLGQWAAFRKWAAPDATMFVPQPVNAQEWLKDRKNPAKAIAWWPTAAWVSCDGTMAVDTGGWKRPDGSVGYFTTVWKKQADGGWKWIVDGGDTLPQPRGIVAAPEIGKGSCSGHALKVELALSVGNVDKLEGGRSTDRTLWWTWEVGPAGNRLFSAQLWNGKNFVPVVRDLIPAPPK